MRHRSWCWHQGYTDGLEGRSAIPPDGVRTTWHFADYFEGYEAGREDLIAKQEQREEC